MDYDFVLAALMRKRNFIASSLAIQKRLDAKLQMKRDADASAQAAPPGDPPASAAAPPGDPSGADASAQAAPPGDPPASAAAPPGDPSGSAEDPAATSDKDDDVPDVEALLTGSVHPPTGLTQKMIYHCVAPQPIPLR